MCWFDPDCFSWKIPVAEALEALGIKKEYVSISALRPSSPEVSGSVTEATVSSGSGTALRPSSPEVSGSGTEATIFSLANSQIGKLSKHYRKF